MRNFTKLCPREAVQQRSWPAAELSAKPPRLCPLKPPRPRKTATETLPYIVSNAKTLFFLGENFLSKLDGS
jgi:hypothetical protein